MYLKSKLQNIQSLKSRVARFDFPWQHMPFLGQCSPHTENLAEADDQHGLVTHHRRYFSQGWLVLYMWAEGFCKGIRQGQWLLNVWREKGVS